MPASTTPPRPTAPVSLALSLLLGMLLTTADLHAQDLAFEDTLRTLPVDGTLPAWGNLGGVTVDRLGFVYVANFHGHVWRLTPDGEATLLSDALYGSSGNAVDTRGRLLQANFFAHTIYRIDRTGAVEPFVEEGLNGPVGMAVWPDGSVSVCNCQGNTIAQVDPDGGVAVLAEGDWFACPNGITIGPDSALYVTNFNNDDLLRVTRTGEVSVFATVPAGGNAHIAYAKGAFYVTKITTNRLVRVTPDSRSQPFTGTGQPGFDNGPVSAATLARPNGIAYDPARSRLYVNTLDGTWNSNEASRIVVRTVDLISLTDVLQPLAAAGDLEALRSTYEAYRAHPLRDGEDTMTEAIRLGYRLLSGGNPTASVAVFELNAATYPERPAAVYNLGEGYRHTGQTDRAAEAYRRVLALDPEHALAQAQLRAIGAAN